MFYRFLSKLATQDRLEAFPVAVPGTQLYESPPRPKDYDTQFAPEPGGVPVPGVQTLRAPLFGADRYGLRLRLHPGKVQHADLPDIWGINSVLITSERVKQVIEAADPFGHEFIEIGWIDANERPVNTEQRYYWFHPRRFLRIPPSERLATPAELGYCAIPDEEDFIARLIDDPTLRAHIEQVPLWRHYGVEGLQAIRTPMRMVVFFNQALTDALWELGIKGFERYSQPFGVGEESVIGIGPSTKTEATP